jgi:hypothetical protein
MLGEVPVMFGEVMVAGGGLGVVVAELLFPEEEQAAANPTSATADRAPATRVVREKPVDMIVPPSCDGGVDLH